MIFAKAHPNKFTKIHTARIFDSSILCKDVIEGVVQFVVHLLDLELFSHNLILDVVDSARIISELGI